MAAVPGNADVHDEVLARAAAGGDRDAFGALFERHLAAVFTAAWFVLRDRAVAAEIARDTFLAAWQKGGNVAPGDFADSLATSADHKAHAWLKENPQGLATANAAGPADPPAIRPVLRARIVSALEIQGVPTKARPDGHRHGQPEQLLDLGPSQPHRERHSPLVKLGIAGAAAVILLVGAVAAFAGNAGGDGAESAAGGDAPERPEDEAAREPISEDEEDEKSPATSTTTTTATTSTTAPATTEPTRTAQGRSTATTGQPATPPPTPAPTTPATTPPTPTTAAPSGPRIIEFTGQVVGSCGNGGVNYQMSWKTSGGSWVWIWPSSDPDPWQDVGGPNGSATRCTHYGETWNIATRHDGTYDNDWREVRASRVV